MFDQQTAFRFDGPCLDECDHIRLTGQLLAVYEVMSDGEWRTLTEIRHRIGTGSEAGISARLRDLRKPKFLGATVERRRLNDSGLFEYRLNVE